MFALNLTRISVYNFHVHYSQELPKMFQNRPNIWNPNLTLLGVLVHCEVCEFLDSSIITNVGCHEHQLQQASKDGRSMLNLRTPIDDESVFFSLVLMAEIANVARFWSFWRMICVFFMIFTLIVYVCVYLAQMTKNPTFRVSENSMGFHDPTFLDRWNPKTPVEVPENVVLLAARLGISNTFHQTWKPTWLVHIHHPDHR